MTTTEYNGNLDGIKFPEGFLDSLKDLPMEEQMERYRVSFAVAFSSTAYGELTREDVRDSMSKLEECDYVKGLIVKDGLLVGVLAKSFWRDEPVRLFPYQTVTTYYASDNEGSGYKEREDNLTLIPVPESMI